MIYSDENEIIQQNKKLKDLKDTFYKINIGIYSKSKKQFEITHKVPHQGAERIFMKIFENYKSLKR